MANQNPTGFGPPDLQGLAHRRLIDPADMPTQHDHVPDLPIESAEVELLSTADGAEPVQALAPASNRPPVPVLRRLEAHRQRRSPQWVGNLVLVAVGLGLLGGIASAVGAVWFFEPVETERWFTRAGRFVGIVQTPIDGGPRGLSPTADDSIVPATPSVIDNEPRLQEAKLGDEIAFDAPDDESTGPDDEEDEAVAEPVEATPAPPPARPRPRRRSVARPEPVAIPKPVPTVRPYSQRPAPETELPAPTHGEDGLIERR